MIVRLLATILHNQNEPSGCEAEDDLCRRIMERYYDVPWLPELRQTFLAKDADPD